jgi:trehalose 6-phosphate synthase/phosphatase
MNTKDRRVIVVSNRLPVVVTQDNQGHRRIERGSGGLVSALCPVLRKSSGMWFGWPGIESDPEIEQLISAHSDECAHKLKPVDLTAKDIELYYNGFSNEILWPLFHDFIWLCNFDPDYWPAYESVNDKFANAVAEHLQPGDVVWVHDYHLLLVGAGLRQREVRNKVGFFLHIPFPSFDGFNKIPWRIELLDGLLQYDVVGLQTDRDVQNFVRCVRALVPSSRVHKSGRNVKIRMLNREVLVGAFPISVDYDGFITRSRTDEVTTQVNLVQNHTGTLQLVLGIDRLDYTKGIPRRLEAFAEALTLYPELRRRIIFLQVIIPSRTDVSRYQSLKEEIERLVGRINGQFTQPGWIPIEYMYRHLCDTELLAYYRSADIALITPLKDGMNLVAKEYCVCNRDRSGVLILSEFAGAAAQLSRDAILVNPFDKKTVAKAIHHAFNMSAEERSVRMHNLRDSIRHNDVFRWVESFMKSFESHGMPDMERQGETSVPRTPITL